MKNRTAMGSGGRARAAAVPATARRSRRAPADVPARPIAAESTIEGRIIRGIVVAFAFAIPLFFTFSGKDVFGLPKEVLFRAEALLLMGTATICWLVGRLPLPTVSARDPRIWVPLAVLFWAGVSTAFSTRPQASFASLGTTIFAVAIFFATIFAARGNRLLPLAIAAAALVNAVIAFTDAQGIWHPFVLEPPPPGPPALLGNPNVAGTYLLAPAIGALAWALSTQGRRRWAASALAIALFAGLLSTRTLTALIAYFVAAFALLLVRSRRYGIVLAAVLVAVAIGTTRIEPMRGRIDRMTELARRGEWNQLFTYRLVAFATALDMAEERPLVGVGPGQYSAHFFDHKIAVEDKHPALFPAASQTGVNFGEAHNDHLQTVAELGVPGYILFLIAVGVLARESFRRRRAPDEETSTDALLLDEESEFARLCAVPLAIAFLVVAIAQFPLQLAAPRLTFLTLAAMCLSGRRNGRD